MKHKDGLTAPANPFDTINMLETKLARQAARIKEVKALLRSALYGSKSAANHAWAYKLYITDALAKLEGLK